MSGSSVGTGRYFAGEKDVFLQPRLAYNSALRRGVIYCHGSGGTAYVAKGSQGVGQLTMLAQLCDFGYPIFSPDLGAPPYQNMGNAEAVARMVDAVAYAQASLGFRAGKVHIIGASMGNTTALKYAIANPSKVASITGIIPFYDLQAARVLDGGLRAPIDTAWGVAYPAALPQNASPVDQISTLVGVVPWTGFYVNNDRQDLLDGALALGALFANNGGKAVDLGALGHGDTAIGAIPVRSLVAWLSKYD